MSKIEQSVYSQNGEDGIIRYLTQRIKRQDRQLLEIGCGGGGQNNSRMLISRYGYGGVLIDRRDARIFSYKKVAEENGFADRCRFIHVHMTISRAEELVGHLSSPRIDFFSLDIDSVDYYILRAMRGVGFRPKVMCLEYNPTLGQEPVTMPYRAIGRHDIRNLYFGCSLAAWRKLLEPDYRFVTVCSDGINAFFVDPQAVDTSDFDDVEWKNWADCPELIKLHGPLEERRAVLADHDLEAV